MPTELHAGLPRVGVLPGRELARRQRLFEALGSSFGVAFVPAGLETAVALDAAVVFSGPAPESVPSLVVAPSTGRAPGMVTLLDTPALDPRLRGRMLADRAAAGPPVAAEQGDVVLGAVSGAAVWLVRRDGRARVAACAPQELGAAESLRDHFVDGRFLELLPLVELLRSVAVGWRPPPPRACFVLDDPNLHRPTYGHADFRILAAHARTHGYHVSVATVPLDGWLVHREAAAVFRSSSELSLAIHGNAHLPGELARPLPAPAREALVAQALRRVEALERRGALRVSRVIVAPHEQCSDEMVETIVRSDVDALCFGYGTRAADRPLADWEPVDLRGSGLPVLPRRPLLASRGELALRAYLDQPLILSLHHDDLAEGLGVLAEAADEIGRIASPRWQSLEEIARASVSVRREGGTLRVRPYARRFAVDVPDGVDRLVVELPPTHAAAERELLLLPGGATRVLSGRVAEPLVVEPGMTLSFRLVRRDAFDHHAVPAPRIDVRALRRRVLVESRDRLAAVRMRRSRRIGTTP